MISNRIRTLYIKSPTPQWMDIAGDLQIRYRFDPVLWVSGTHTHHEACLERFPDTRFFDHFEALRGKTPIPAGTHTLTVDSEFLKRNAHHENIFTNMMDRWCGNPEKISIEKRRCFYIDMANSWMTLYDTLKIESVIIPTIPHRLYDYMAYIVAQDQGIPFLAIEQTNELLFQESGERNNIFYVLQTLENRSDIITKNLREDRTPSPALQRYIETFDADYNAAQPLYFKTKNLKKSTPQEKLKACLKNIPLAVRLPLQVLRAAANHKTFHTRKLTFPYQTKTGQEPVRYQTLLSALIEHDCVQKNARAARAYYEAHSTTDPDLTQNYIYFAPSFQPERTSTPDAGLCQWVELMIEMLNASIPPDWNIFYKEHPSNFREPIRPDNNRTVALYQRLQHLAPRITFLPTGLDPFPLMASAKAVATSTGTSAWQAATRGTPAMAFGEAWFSASPDIGHIKSLSDCKAFIAKIQSGWKPDRNRLIQYLCALETLGGAYDWARAHKPYEITATQKHPYKTSVQDLSDDLYRVYCALTAQDGILTQKVHA